MKKRKNALPADVPDFDMDAFSSFVLPPKKEPVKKPRKRKKVSKEYDLMDFFSSGNVPVKQKEVIVSDRKEVIVDKVHNDIKVSKGFATIDSVEFKAPIFEKTSVEWARSYDKVYHMDVVNQIRSFIEKQEESYDDHDKYDDIRILIVHGLPSCGKSWCVEKASEGYEYDVLDFYGNGKASKGKTSDESNVSSLKDIVQDALCMPSDDFMFTNDDSHEMRIVCVEDVDTFEDYRVSALLRGFKLSHKDLWPVTAKECRLSPKELRRSVNVLIVTATDLYTGGMYALKQGLRIKGLKVAYKEIQVKPLTLVQSKDLCNYVCIQMGIPYDTDFVCQYYESTLHMLHQLELRNVNTGVITNSVSCMDENRGNNFEMMKHMFNPSEEEGINDYERDWSLVGDRLYSHIWNNYMDQGPGIVMIEDCLDHLSDMSELFSITLGVHHGDKLNERSDALLMIGTKVYHTDLMKKANTYVSLKRSNVNWHNPKTLNKFGSGKKNEKVRGTGVVNLISNSDWDVARSMATIHRLQQDKKMKDIANFKHLPRYDLKRHLGTYATLKSTSVYTQLYRVLRSRKVRGVFKISVVADMIWCYLPWEDRYLERNQYELDDDYQSASKKKLSSKKSKAKTEEMAMIKSHALTSAFKLLNTRMEFNNKKDKRS